MPSKDYAFNCVFDIYKNNKPPYTNRQLQKIVDFLDFFSDRKKTQTHERDIVKFIETYHNMCYYSMFFESLQDHKIPYYTLENLKIHVEDIRDFMKNNTAISKNSFVTKINEFNNFLYSVIYYVDILIWFKEGEDGFLSNREHLLGNYDINATIARIIDSEIPAHLQGFKGWHTYCEALFDHSKNIIPYKNSNVTKDFFQVKIDLPYFFLPGEFLSDEECTSIVKLIENIDLPDAIANNELGKKITNLITLKQLQLKSYLNSCDGYITKFKEMQAISNCPYKGKTYSSLNSYAVTILNSRTQLNAEGEVMYRYVVIYNPEYKVLRIDLLPADKQSIKTPDIQIPIVWDYNNPLKSVYVTTTDNESSSIENLRVLYGDLWYSCSDVTDIIINDNESALIDKNFCPTSSTTGAGRRKTLATKSQYVNTGTSYTDGKGVRRVVYQKGATKYVKVKDIKTGKFRYKKVRD